MLRSLGRRIVLLCLYLNTDAESVKRNLKSLCSGRLKTGSPVPIASLRKSRGFSRASTAFPAPATARLTRCPPDVLPAAPPAAQVVRAPEAQSYNSLRIGSRDFPEADLRNRDQAYCHLNISFVRHNPAAFA